MKFRRQVRTEDSINVTPLIDVVFLLLIFFMVSTTFTKETHLKIDLPQASGEPSSDRVEQVEVTINSEGGYSVNGESLINKKIATLKQALERVSAGDNELPLVITSDANTPMQSVVTAMDAAGQMGFVHLRFTTRQPKADSEP